MSIKEAKIFFSSKVNPPVTKNIKNYQKIAKISKNKLLYKNTVL